MASRRRSNEDHVTESNLVNTHLSRQPFSSLSLARPISSVPVLFPRRFIHSRSVSAVLFKTVGLRGTRSLTGLIHTSCFGPGQWRRLTGGLARKKHAAHTSCSFSKPSLGVLCLACVPLASLPRPRLESITSMHSCR